jgi:2'-5' RNA ligase
MNLSLAVTIPEDVKRKLAAAIERLAPEAEDTLWTERDQLQLPIVTVGEIAPAFVPHITAALSKICAHTPVFPLHLYGYGFFGTKRFPHNAWAAVDSSEVLTNMHTEIWDALKKFGFEKPDEDYLPHVMLGICKAGIRNKRLVDAMDEDHDCEFGLWDVKKITLYDCKTSNRGKVHRKVNQILLMR